MSIIIYDGIPSEMEDLSKDGRHETTFATEIKFDLRAYARSWGEEQ